MSESPRKDNNAMETQVCMILVRTSNEFQGQMRLVLGILVLKIEFSIFQA